MTSRFWHKVRSIPRFIRIYGQHWTSIPRALFRVRCDVRLVRGKLRDGGEPVTVLYVGRDLNYAYVIDTVLADAQIVSAARASVFSVRRLSDEQKPLCDVMIVDMSWPYLNWLGKDPSTLVVPDWINMAVNTDMPWERVRRNFTKSCRNNDLRLIRREGLQFDVCHDTKAFAHFYDSLYLPHVLRRHVDHSVVEPRWHVLKTARKAGLLRVFRGNNLICAGVLGEGGGELQFLWLGVDASAQKATASAAIGALYFFGFQYAVEQGQGSVSIGGTRAFLSDGDFRFKRKWGANADISFSPNTIGIEPAATGGGVAFCANQPLLIKAHGGLYAFYVQYGSETTPEKLTRNWNEIACAGIGGMITICVCGSTKTTVESQRVAGAILVKVCCSMATFSQSITEALNSLEANKSMPSNTTIDAGNLIEWPTGQQLNDQVARARHRLIQTGMFTDDKLIELFDKHNPDELLVYRMGDDHHKLDDFQYGARGDLTAEQLLKAVKDGRLWLNIIHMMENHSEFDDLVNAMYDELEEKVPGFKTVFRNANLLISSPSSKVYYHADAPLNMLWHIRGKKRVWVYPNTENFAPREWVEMIFTRQSDDDLPYSPEFDKYASENILQPGEMVTWGQNTPHRVDNLEGLNVSLTTEHYTPQAMRKRMTYLSNHYLRRWFGLPATGVAIDGPVPAAKRTLFRIARRLPGFRESREEYDDPKFSLERK